MGTIAGIRGTLATAGATSSAISGAQSAAPVAPSSASAAADGSSDSIIERGKYLVEAGNCMSCHTRPGGARFSGGRAFTTKFGTIYSSNITPDVETGIGNWNVDDLRRAMHHGIAAGGYRLFPAFPYPSFTKVSDEDIVAVYAYLRTLQPVRYSPPANSFLFRQRWVMRFWNMLFFTPGRFEPDAKESKAWNRGAYLVEGLGHCGACHSPRNILMATIANRAYSGGRFQDRVAPGRIRRWSAVNLTSSKDGLAAWSMDNLAKYLKTGVCPRAGVFGPMDEVIDNSLKYLSAGDIRAMAVYLKSLRPQGSSVAALPPEAAMKSGAAIYHERCEECHMSSGRGGFLSAPPLQGSAVVQANDPASLINIILYGPDTPKDIPLGPWETMEPYKGALSDAEVAAVSDYVRESWNNRADAVTPAEVARQR